MTIDRMRKHYELAGLDESDSDPDPMVHFRRWFEEARQADLPEWVEVNAMTLSTASPAGEVTSRVVLLKGIEDDRLSFFTNYQSAKAAQIAANPHVSLCFFWPHLQRQVRIEGTAGKSDRQRSEDYFRSRPRASQLGAHVSRQSAEIAGRGVLEDSMRALESRYEGVEVECPEHWGGYDVQPTRFEFWQGRPSRLQDRLAYHRQAGAWRRVRLAP